MYHLGLNTPWNMIHIYICIEHLLITFNKTLDEKISSHLIYVYRPKFNDEKETMRVLKVKSYWSICFVKASESNANMPKIR